jgi:hypothetical protein
VHYTVGVKLGHVQLGSCSTAGYVRWILEQQFLFLYTAGYVRWILEPTVSISIYSRLCALDTGANSFYFYIQQVMCVRYWSQQFLFLYTAGYVRWILEPTLSISIYSRPAARRSLKLRLEIFTFLKMFF